MNESGDFYTTTNDYKLINNSGTYATIISDLQIHGLTNALIYFSNNSVACSDINTCDDNINITLTPNSFSYVLDEYNLTIGASDRANDPIWTPSTGLMNNSLNDSVTFSIFGGTPTLSDGTLLSGTKLNNVQFTLSPNSFSTVT